MSLDANKFDRTDPSTGKTVERRIDVLYVAEAAELGLFGTINPRVPPRNFLLLNCPDEGQHRTFSLVDTDMSGGDIAGWRYEEDAGPNKGNTSWCDHGRAKACEPYRVLIIND